MADSMAGVAKITIFVGGKNIKEYSAHTNLKDHLLRLVLTFGSQLWPQPYGPPSALQKASEAEPKHLRTMPTQDHNRSGSMTELDVPQLPVSLAWHAAPVTIW